MQSADQDIAQQQQQLMAPIATKMKEAIESVGRENSTASFRHSHLTRFFSTLLLLTTSLRSSKPN